jgi:hypothetical protein
MDYLNPAHRIAEAHLLLLAALAPAYRGAKAVSCKLPYHLTYDDPHNLKEYDK